MVLSSLTSDPTPESADSDSFLALLFTGLTLPGVRSFCNILSGDFGSVFWRRTSIDKGCGWFNSVCVPSNWLICVTVCGEVDASSIRNVRFF